MNRFSVSVFALLLISFLATCKSNKEEKSANPLWGLWLQVEPVTSSKCELMFNEDFSGFVFNADTLVSQTTWSHNDVLKVNYSANSIHGVVETVVYDCILNADTLVLNDKSSLACKRYLRVKE
ncbi:MAG: hypothetical protein IKJ31_00700 [Bacteroidaceae bacterium]|nr:hypothetical protein [Bacteroidaceae bacterium]